MRERIVIDPRRHSRRATATPRAASRDDGFAALELSIHPEDVTPILRKLIQPTNTRARIYARDGTLIVDTARSLAAWTARCATSRAPAATERAEATEHLDAR